MIVHEKVPYKLISICPLESFRIDDYSFVSVKVGKLSDKVGWREIVINSWLVDAAA